VFIPVLGSSVQQSLQIIEVLNSATSMVSISFVYSEEMAFSESEVFWICDRTSFPHSDRVSHVLLFDVGSGRAELYGFSLVNKSY